MELSLKGKVALITGSTEGIGLAIARKLLENKAQVIVNGRTPAKVSQAIDDLNSIRPGAASGFAGDLSKPQECGRLFEQVPEVDILINNLGIYTAKEFEDITDEEWRDLFEVNVLSGIRMSRFYFPKMKKRNWGRILFISSESGIATPAEMIHYGVTKTAQIAVSRGLAELTRDTGVTVNTILPGPTRTPGVEKYLNTLATVGDVTPEQAEKQFFATFRPTSLLQRLIEPDEVANTVAFFASPLSAATNGAAIRVEGGLLRTIL
jgi:NAD(P)-dependent dehydrogenase (short-subunit alcohol dehydrogenase family)